MKQQQIFIEQACELDFEMWVLHSKMKVDEHELGGAGFNWTK